MDIPILAETNAPPTPNQESFFLERLASVDSYITEITNELAYAQELVANLSSRQSTLREKRRVYTSIISPLRRLPSDILSEIFFFVVWSSAHLVADSSKQKLSSISGGHTLVPPSTGLISSKSLTHKHTMAPALEPGWLQEKQLATLLRVCQEWRQVAIFTPLLWSHVQLQIYSNDPPLDCFVQDLQTWFDRAQHVPLSLTLFFSKSSDDPLPTQFPDFIHRNKPRWKELKLNMPSLRTIVSLFNPPKRETSGSERGNAIDEGANDNEDRAIKWSHLEVLSLCGWLSEGADADIFSMDSFGGNELIENPSLPGQENTMPNLKSLTLHLPYRKICTWNWIPWPQLTHLSLRSGDLYEDYVAFLARCADLRRCRLFFNPSPRFPVLDSHVGEHEDAVATQTGYIRLLFLEELSLESINFLVPLLSKLVIPSINRLSIAQDLRLWLQAPESSIGSTLVDLLLRSSEANNNNKTPPLTFLNLHMYGYAGDFEPGVPRIGISEYVQMFEMLEGLKELHIKDGATNAEFLDIVQRKGLLPHLKRISVEVGRNEEARERFKSFVRARTLSE